jgi:hypothetical protein
MITANLKVDILQFRPLGGVFPITCSISLIEPSSGVKVHEGNIVVTDKEPASLVFQLSNPAYVFVGVAFDAQTPDSDVGATEFPTVTINRLATGNPPRNSLTVLDANNPANAKKRYTYALLIQKKATGEIGLIDPVIINDGGP